MSNKKKPSAKSAEMKKITTKPAAAKEQRVSGEAKSNAGAKSGENVAKAVRPMTPTSAGQARQVVFEVASDALLSLIRSNFDTLRISVKKSNDVARHDRATGGKAGEDLLAALDRLEVGYRELLRGK